MGPKGNNKPIEKLSKSDFNESMKTLLLNLKKYYPMIILSLICSTIGAILTIVGPNQLSKITDAIQEGLMTTIDLPYIKEISLMLICFYILSFFFQFLQSYVMSIVTQKYCRQLRTDIANKLTKLKLSYFDRNLTGDILSKISNDVDVISQSLNSCIGNLMQALVLLIGIIIMMFSTNIVMTITAILSSFIGFACMAVILRKSEKYFTAQQEGLGKLNGFIEENYSSLTTINLHNAKDKSIEDFNEYNHVLYDSAHKSQFLSGLMPSLMGFIGNFSYVSVTVMGAYLVLEGHITFGVIVAYMIYVRIFINPLSTIAQSFSSLQQVSASVKRVYDFLDEEELEKEKSKLIKINPSKIKGDVVFENIMFGYNEDKMIIKDFSANVKAGQTVAIVGPTGAGKTTLVNLLIRFYEINSGLITIDGKNIQDIKREELHDLFCMVLQDSWIFEDTVYENVRFNQSNITEKQIEDVCKEIGIDHLIRSLPSGYNSILGDCDSLSTGEKQLLTIARAALKKSPFLILDEATSSVDTRTEVLVQKAMESLMENKTSFIIAHRLSTIRNADLILVLKDGNIIEQGNHKTLLKNKGFYSDLYNSQFEK